MRLQRSLARHRDWVERECLRYLQEQPAGQQQLAEVKVSVMSMECMLVGLVLMNRRSYTLYQHTHIIHHQFIT